MKVLEKGPGWSIKQICTGSGNGGGGCGTLLQIEAGDIYVTSRCFIDEEVDYYYTFRCCECGKETDIPNKDVPYSIQKEAKQNKKTLGGRYGYRD